MKTKHWIMIVICCCLMCCTALLVQCNTHQNEYRPNLYSQNEVIALYKENKEAFNIVVDVVSNTPAFYENGRINEYENPSLTSPYDKHLKWFNDTDRVLIVDFFKLKPYMISYDRYRRFVKITFIGSDEHEGYTLLFWLKDDTSEECEREDYKNYLLQDYDVTDIDEKCFIYYKR